MRNNKKKEKAYAYLVGQKNHHAAQLPSTRAPHSNSHVLTTGPHTLIPHSAACGTLLRCMAGPTAQVRSLALAPRSLTHRPGVQKRLPRISPRHTEEVESLLRSNEPDLVARASGVYRSTPPLDH
jgi:hypothetical protein